MEQKKTDTELLDMLLGAIDYSFLKTDGTYDLSLTYPVIDKIHYIEKVRKQTAIDRLLKEK